MSKENEIRMEPGYIYFLKFGGTEVVGRYQSDDACNYYFYDYLHNWAGHETFHKQSYTVKGADEIREATMTEKQALLRKSLEHGTI